MVGEKPNAQFEPSALEEVVPPRGLETNGIKAILTPYQEVKFGLFAERERVLKKNLAWAKAAGRYLLPNGRSSIVATLGYDNERGRGTYYTYSTSADLIMSLYAIREHGRQSDQQDDVKPFLGETAVGLTQALDQPILQVGQETEGALNSQEDLISERNLFSTAQWGFERSRSEAGKALNLLRRQLETKGKRLYLRGLPRTITFALPAEAESHVDVLDTYKQYFHYLRPAKAPGMRSNAPSVLLKPDDFLPKLLPLITQSEGHDEAMMLLQNLVVSSRRAVDENMNIARNGSGEWIKADDHRYEKYQCESSDTLTGLLNLGYAEFKRSFLPQISVSIIYEGHFRNFREETHGTHPED